MLHGETRTGLSRHFEGNRCHSVFPTRQTDRSRKIVKEDSP